MWDLHIQSGVNGHTVPKLKNSHALDTLHVLYAPSTGFIGSYYGYGQKGHVKYCLLKAALCDFACFQTILFSLATSNVSSSYNSSKNWVVVKWRTSKIKNAHSTCILFATTFCIGKDTFILKPNSGAWMTDVLEGLWELEVQLNLKTEESGKTLWPWAAAWEKLFVSFTWINLELHLLTLVGRH